MGDGQEYLAPVLLDNKTPLGLLPAKITWSHCPLSQSAGIKPELGQVNPIHIGVMVSPRHMLNPGG